METNPIRSILAAAALVVAGAAAAQQAKPPVANVEAPPRVARERTVAESEKGQSAFARLLQSAQCVFDLGPEQAPREPERAAIAQRAEPAKRPDQRR